VLVERDLPKLLTLVATVPAPAYKTFRAADRFRADTGPAAKVRIGWLGDNFKKHFLPKVEKNTPAANLAIATLAQASLDAPVLKELGTRAETALAHLWHLLSLQPQGQSGPLLVNGCANIFYIKDTSGTLWAVRAGWDADYGDWHVEACSMSSPSGWVAGRRVVSRT
jgi:hypothetical protein